MIKAGGIVTMFALYMEGSASSAVTAPPVRTTLIAACDFADGRSAMVLRTSNRYEYRFSRRTSREIELIGDARTKTVFQSRELYPCSGWTQIRFVNGTASYLMLHYYNLGNYVKDYEGVANINGLIVFENGHRLSMRICKTSEGLQDDSEISGLPEDPEDHSDDIIDDVERRH